MEDRCPRCGQAITDCSICPNCSYPYEQNEQTYQKALAMMQRCRTPLSFRGCAEMFDSVSEHKDSKEKAEACRSSAASLENGESIEVSSNKATGQQEEPQMTSAVKKSSKAATYLGIAVCAVLVILIAVYSVSIASLKKNFAKDWYALDDSIIKVLDISGDEIEYRLETGYEWLNMTAAVFDWKPAFGNKVKIRLGDTQRTYRVQFNKDKDVMTLYPALTEASAFETWYHIE